MFIKKIIIILLSFIIGTFAFFTTYNVLFPLDYKRIFKAQSTLIYDKNQKLIRIKLSPDGYYRFTTNKNEIPLLLKKSVLNFEDRYFYQHFGVNPVALIKAFFHNLKSQRKIGASTITMQVARMMQHKKRTFINKLIEMMTAFQIEWYYTKDEILSMYFNLAPYGGNIEGIKTASWFYYKKSLSNLSIAQIATLTTIPKNPNVNRPDKAKNLYLKRLRVLRILLKEKLINIDQFNRAFKEPFLKKRFLIPFIAPHFTSYFKKEGIFESSLNQDIQKNLLQTLQIHSKKLHHFDLHNASGIIINNKSMKIVAYVGSDKFFDKTSFGQNNGVTMIRSPGSSLKPFIYAKALDNGLITPKKELFDLPLHIKGYNPQNYFKNFTGEVSAEIALQDSLNIPAVELNNQLQNDSLYELLLNANVKSVNQNKPYYGDSIALGGFGISLFDLAHLYTSFANEGNLKTIGFTKDHNSTIKIRLFSKEAAFIVNEILSDAIRPEFSSYWESSVDMIRVAFKTGTSANSKDLYSIGVTPEYTVAIWMGNFSGEPTKNLTGLDTSSKALFEVFSFLSRYEKPSWFKKPHNVLKREICTDAIKFGKCRTLEEDYVIKNVTLKRPCKLLRAEVLAYLSEKKVLIQEDMMKHKCYNIWLSYPPLINSIYNKQVIIRNLQNKLNLPQIMLKCYSFKENQTITWLIDNDIPIKGKSQEEVFYKLDNGKHRIACLDEASLMSEVNIIIKEE